MKDEYIRKQDAIDTISMDGINCHEELVDIWAIERIPAADVAPVVHGKWLPIVSYKNTYKCSECGRLLVNIADGKNKVAKHYPYCHCGAKMDGERKE